MTKPFRCMKAPSESVDPATLKFPMYSSYKLDGIRCTIMNGQPMSTSMTPLPSRYARRFCRADWEGLDGELIAREARPGLVYKDSHSACMTHDSLVPLRFHVFDWVMDKPYAVRLKAVHTEFSFVFDDEVDPAYLDVSVLEQRVVSSVDDVYAHEAEALDAGHEGLMIRTLDGPYKPGRSTALQGYIFKLVRHEIDEAVVLGVYERMHNANEAQISALGLTKRSTHKANLQGLGTMGGFHCQDLKTDVEFDVGTGEGLDDATRAEIWRTRETWPGRIVKYKRKPYGQDKRPRQPVLIWERDRRDM